MGLIWALLSVGLVSAAQLAMRQAMLLLGQVGVIPKLLSCAPGTLILMAGVGGYLISMVCWYFALRRLPLSKAYALLALSYIVVWIAAIYVPGWHDRFSWQGGAGVLLIAGGVMMIFLPARKGAEE